jgi:hypothetical protein
MDKLLPVLLILPLLGLSFPRDAQRGYVAEQ